MCDKCTIEKLENHILFLEADIAQLKANGGREDVYVIIANRKDKDAVVCAAFTHHKNAVKNQKQWEETAPQHKYVIQGIDVTDSQYPPCTTPTYSRAKMEPSIQVLQQMSPPEL